MAGVSLLALDGAGQIGGSKLLLRTDENQVLLDFGASFHKYGKYYEEFLKPRSAGGLLDFVVMGVLPNARNLYRPDLVHPELNLDGVDVGKIDALFLSHAHADHFGDMGFLRLDIPLVTSAMSAAIVKAMADSNKGDIGKDFVHPSMKRRNTFRGAAIIESCSSKDFDGFNAKGRDVVISDDGIPADFSSFWGLAPSIRMAENPKRCRPQVPGDLLGHAESVKFKAYPVDHSVKGARAYVISTSQGNVIYTGDLRMHGINGRLTEEFAESARSPRPYALIIEGTRVGRKSDSATDEANVTEELVRENAARTLSEAGKEFVIADFGPRNIERLEIFLDAAKEHHRKMVVTTKDAYLLHAMNSVENSVPVPGDDIMIYECPKGKEGKYEEFILDVAYPGSSVGGKAVASSPGDYLMAFSFFDLKHLVDIRPQRGHYLYSSCEAFSEEQEIDFIRMKAWLDKFRLVPHGLSFVEMNGTVRPEFPKGRESLHASGHASKEDLEKIVRTLDPEVIVPVHTTDPQWFVDEFGGQCRVVIPQEASWVDL